ncbi:MAG: hypothetical protein J6I45_05760, partial [Clostridia bacterium]|nr:hypothetical protein [Clostridia bacterium]
ENATVNIETNKFNYDFKCRDCGEVQTAAYRTNREAATECVQAATCILPEQTRFTYVVSIAGHGYVSGSYTLEAIVDTKEALGHDWDNYAGKCTECGVKCTMLNMLRNMFRASMTISIRFSAKTAVLCCMKAWK